MESALAWQENIRFENFLIEMMDLEVDGRVPTSEHIAPMLANNGWNLQEVASIWTVSSAGPPAGTWNDSAIEKLAGKGAVNRIWNSLKSNQQTGFPKRPRTEDESGPKKRFRQSLEGTEVSKIVGNDTLKASSLMDSRLPESATVVNPTLFCPRKPGRKLLNARRRDPAAVRNKITWWLERDQDTSQEDAATPEPSLPTLPTPTSQPSHSKTPSKKTGKKRGRKVKKNQATPATTCGDQEEDPKLHNRPI